jgi:hypothetical protein
MFHFEWLNSAATMQYLSVLAPASPTKRCAKHGLEEGLSGHERDMADPGLIERGSKILQSTSVMCGIKQAN